jgi:hypothetical protein
LASSLTFPLSGLDQQQSDLGTTPRARHAEAEQWGWGGPQGCAKGLLLLFFFSFFKAHEKERPSKQKLVLSSPGKRHWQSWCRYTKTVHFCLAAKFTELPRNVTATEGQNVEMSCAFQSGSASVYLEIQWWFLRGPEDLEQGTEAAGSQVAIAQSPQSPRMSLC